MDKIIKGGTVIDPATNEVSKRDVYIRNGVIIEKPENHTTNIVDATGKWVVPGLTDMHVHFRDPGFPLKENIYSGLRAAAKGGMTTVVTMANTSPVTDTPELVNYQFDKGVKAKLGRLIPVSAITKNMDGNQIVDVDAHYKNGIMAFSEDGKSIKDPDVLEQFMKELRTVGEKHGRMVPVLDHCEDTWGEDLVALRDIQIALSTGISLHIQHVSMAATVDIIRKFKPKFAARGLQLTCETAPHYFSLTEADFKKHGPDAQMSPRLKTEKDRQAIIAALRDGTIDVIATDHAPHTVKEKSGDNPPNGIIGLETAVGLALTELYHTGEIGELELVKKMTVNPAKIMGLKTPSLAPNSRADVTIIEPTTSWLVAGSDLESKSRNMPYNGMILKGMVSQTICDGETIYRE
jgi:dihydroorotase